MGINNASRSSGYMGLIILVVMFFAFLLAGGLWGGYHLSNGNFYYRPIIPNGSPDSKKSLQLQTFHFQSIASESATAPTIPLTPPPRPVLPQIAFSCGRQQIPSFEPSILFSSDPAPNNIVVLGGNITVWYLDEHALTLGKTNVPPMKNNPEDRQFSSSDFGDKTKDTDGYFLFPALYITDITNDPTDTSGDAEKGGQPYTPDEMCGTWKTVNADDPQQPNATALTNLCGPFPAKRNLGVTPPREDTQYKTKIVWHTNNLPLLSNHLYRVEFLMHDGDTRQSGFGDVGEGCIGIQS